MNSHEPLILSSALIELDKVKPHLLQDFVRAIDNDDSWECYEGSIKISTALCGEFGEGVAMEWNTAIHLDAKNFNEESLDQFSLNAKDQIPSLQG